ncbi:MAG: BamA/TamA family outer membrane protein [Bacteroidales bacterium]|nr:BamA/TamA family outer membrane protein [Bacteroidales bacterium]
MKAIYILFRNLAFILILYLASCSPTRKLQDNQYMLIKNKVDIINPSKNVSAGGLEGLIQQKPNKKFLGIFPIKLWIHGIFKKSGEPPVILDLSLVNESKDQMRKYLDNVGYFNSEVSDTIRYKKKKAKKVIYLISLSKPYRIRNINYRIPDDSIKNIVINNNSNSLLKPDKIFNSNTLDKERSRIAQLLNDNGYFRFTKDYIYYEVDSALNNRQIDLTLFIKNIIIPGSNPDQKPLEENHKIYYINEVFIYPDFLPFMEDSIKNDTLIEKLKQRGYPEPNLYSFIYCPPLKIRPKVLTRSMFLEGNEKYNATDVRQTYKKINELRIYKYVNINFRKSNDTTNLNPNLNFLDCTVQLTRNPLNSYSVGAQGTNSGGDLGITGYVVYKNKNLFRGAEVLNIRFQGSMEAQKTFSTSEGSEKNDFLFFNTFETGIEASLYIPKFLAPISQDIFSRYFRPKTTIKTGYNFQNRIEYNRIITNVTFGYEWSETRFKKHELHPIDINLIKVNTTPEFDSILANESQRFQNQYTDHMIFGLRYSYIFNNQEINKIKNFFYFRGNVELAGNLLNTLVKAWGGPENAEGFRTVFGIRYSQYSKTNFDLRYYILINKDHSLAFRSFVGVAIPYGNSVDIPFEKGYYGGGANGMRAWALRYLGPGSYHNIGSHNIERVGDIMLEGNFEYRFAIYKIFKGAFFYDIGNIWLLSKNETYPGGEFQFSSFPGELAMDVGVGIRLDLNYFIFRIDIAQKLKDPALPQGQRWVIGNSKKWFNPVFNMGIGYPF